MPDAEGDRGAGQRHVRVVADAYAAVDAVGPGVDVVPVAPVGLILLQLERRRDGDGGIGHCELAVCDGDCPAAILGDGIANEFITIIRHRGQRDRGAFGGHGLRFGRHFAMGRLRHGYGVGHLLECDVYHHIIGGHTERILSICSDTIVTVQPGYSRGAIHLVARMGRHGEGDHIAFLGCSPAGHAAAGGHAHADLVFFNEDRCYCDVRRGHEEGGEGGAGVVGNWIPAARGHNQLFQAIPIVGVHI